LFVTVSSFCSLFRPVFVQGSPLGILNSYRNCTELQYWELHILLPACHSLPAVLPLSHTVLSLQSPGFMNSDPPVDQSEQQPEPEEELPSRAPVPRQGETIQPVRPTAVDVPLSDHSSQYQGHSAFHHRNSQLAASQNRSLQSRRFPICTTRFRVP
jgi:hypothetical protein